MDIFELATRLTSTGEQQVLVSLDRVAKQGEKTAERTSTAWASAAKYIAGAISVAAVTSFFRASIAESIQAAEALGRYQVAVRNAGDSLEEFEPLAQAAAKALQATTKFDDDTAMDALATLTNITGSASAGLENLGLAADIAAAKQLDLVSAAQLVGRAATGNTAMLSRYGIQIREGADAMEELRQKFAGFAATQGAGPGGQLARVANTFRDLQESIGNAITRSAQWTKLMNRLIEVLQGAARWVEANTDTVTVFATVLGRTAEAIVNILGAAAQGWAYIWGGMQVAVVGVVGYFQSLPARLKMYLGSALDTIVDFTEGAARVFDRVFGTDLASGVLRSLRQTAIALRTAGAEELQRYEDAFIETSQNILDQAAGNGPTAPRGTGRGRNRRTGTDDEAQSAEEAAKATEQYRQEYEKLLATWAEGVNFEATRNESLEGLRAAYTRTANALTEANLPLERRVELYQRLQGLREAIATGQEAEQVARTAALTRQNDAAIAKLQTDVQASLPAMIANSQAMMAALGPALTAQAISAFDDLNRTFQDASATIGDTLAQSLGAAFTGGLGDAKTIALQGLGSIFTAMGTSLIKYGLAMLKLLPALSNPFTSGPAALAAGALLVGLGKALGGAATSSSGGSSGGTGPSGPSFDNYRAAQDNVVRVIVGAPAGSGPGGAAEVRAKPAVNVTVIGTADPVAVRDIGTMVNAAIERGLVPGR